MPRPQFTLKSLLWLMALVAVTCGLAGNGWRWWRRTLERTSYFSAVGSVLVDGQKQGHGWFVTFSSCDSTATSAIGMTDERGIFELRTPMQGVFGAYPGDYLVGIVPPKEQRSQRFGRYADPNDSGIKATVRPGGNVFQFDLSEP